MINRKAILPHTYAFQNNLYFDDQSLLNDLASDCGIDWSKLQNHITFDGRKVTRGIELSKSYRGKVLAVGTQFTTKDGRDYKRINFYTNKHGGVSHTYSEWHEAKSRKSIGEIAPVIPFKKKVETTVKPTFDNAPTDKQVTDLKIANERWNEATTDNVANHPYLIAKSLPIKGVEIRHGIGKYGECLMVQIFNTNLQVIGYQHLYAQNLTNRNDNKDFLGQIGEGFAIIGGTFDDCINGAYHVEGLSTGLAVYHANGAKGELNNKHHLPVVVSFSAGNLGKVIDAFMARGCENQRIAADNDCGKANGNTGVYVAMVAAQKHNLPIFLPVSKNGTAVDFADTLAFKTLNVNKMRYVDFLKKLSDVAPTGQLRRLFTQLANAIADCVPSKMSKETAIALIHELMAKRGMDSSKVNVRGIIHNHLHKRAERLKKWNTLVNKSGLERHDLKGKTNEEIAKYINEIKGIWLDNRCMGAGKTKLMAILRKLKKYDRIAYLTHRISLTKNASGIMNLDYYNDLGYGEGTDGIALCANSLLKYKVETGGFNVLFLDEFRQILDHLIDGSVENRQAVWDGFCASIRAADFMVCSDADLNDRCVEFLKQHCGNKKIHLIEAEEFDTNGKTYHLLKQDNFKSMYIRILRELQAGKKPFVGCTSKKEAKRLHKFLIEQGIEEKDLLLIHSDNRGDVEQSKFLADPNSEADNYRCVIHSPTVGSGVSVEVGEFSNVYLLHSGNITSNEAFQMTARYRKAKHIYIAFGAQPERNRMTDEDLLHEGYNKTVSHYTVGKGIANELGKARIALHAQQNADKNDFQNNFALLVELKGGTLDYSLIDQSLTQEETAAIKGITQRAKKADIEAITIATDMSSEEFDTQKNIAPTQADSYRRYRYLTKQMAGLPYAAITEFDVENFINDDFKRVMNLENLKASIPACQAWDKNNALTQERFKSKTSIKTLIEPLIERLLVEEFIDTKIALRECEYLQQHAPELAANGIGNYKHIGSRPVTTLANLVKQFGYKLGFKIQPRVDGKQMRRY
ncbi:MAG: plasmid replication protein, CyRepA1 family, partial [Methylococcaceae bacterium]